MTDRQPIVLPCGVTAFVTRDPKLGVWVGVRTESEILRGAWFRSVEVAAADMNERVLNLRAALLPPGAIVVRPDDPETIARGAKAVLDMIRRGDGTRDMHGDIVRAVLAALKPSAPECGGSATR